MHTRNMIRCFLYFDSLLKQRLRLGRFKELIWAVDSSGQIRGIRCSTCWLGGEKPDTEKLICRSCWRWREIEREVSERVFVFHLMLYFFSFSLSLIPDQSSSGHVARRLRLVDGSDTWWKGTGRDHGIWGVRETHAHNPDTVHVR